MYRAVSWAILLNFCVLIPLTGQVRGLDPTREIAHYAHHAWTKRDGLPQNSVTSIAQTPDGYLWFGTMEGLARFDGTSFTILNTRNTPQLGTNYILCLLTSRDSTMWIATNGAGVLRYRHGAFTPVSIPSGSEPVVTTDLMEDREGNVWVSSTVGLAKFRGDSLIHLYTSSDGLPVNLVYDAAEDREGHILAVVHEGIWINKGECFEPYIGCVSGGSKEMPTPPVEQEYARKERLLSIPLKAIVDRHGALWVGTAKGEIHVLTAEGMRTITKKDGLGPGHITALYEDQRGTIWAGTYTGGLARIVNNRVTKFSSYEGLSGDEVLSIEEDREGVLWVGVATGGVNKFVNSKFTAFRTGPGTIENMVWGIFSDCSGRLMASTAAGTLMEYKNGIFVPASILPGTKNPAEVCYSYVCDRSGTQWVGSSSGVRRYSRDGVRMYPIGNASSLAVDRYGRIWAITPKGLWCFTSGNPFVVMPVGEDRAHIPRAVGLDAAGHLWLAFRFSGVTRYRLPAPTGGAPVLDKSTAVHFGTREGLLSDWITSMMVDSNGVAWVAPKSGGLNVIRGDSVYALSPSQGLPEEMIMGCAPDGRGDVWLTCNNGLHRISIKQLFDFFDGHATSVTVHSYGTSDGMYSDEFNGGYQSCIARTPDGKIWFPSTFGVVMVDPARLPTNPIPPAVVLERVRIDNTEGLPREGSEYPPGNGDLEFHFVGLSSIAPERIQFRYRLDGFNKDWIDAGTRRDAYYTNIPPGNYCFRVNALNADGVWNDAGVAFPFVLRPRFSQTVWFGIMVAGLIAAFIVMIWFLYKRDRDRELQASQLESKLAQAQVQILEMQLQPHFLFNTLNGIMVLIRQDPDMASRMIARLSEFLRLTLDSAGEQEVTLRRELEYLTRYIQIEQLRFGDRLTVEQSVNPEDLEALVPNLILQPLVENAIRHGVSRRRGPARISIEATRDNGSLTIHVRDNGTGLQSDPGGNLKEGIGIRNTRSRLKYLYGNAQEFGLSSPASGGVDVKLCIPYHKSGKI
jgi:ligand-binding sensor domain-containing protein/two-component sensor histidine kinase